MASVVAFLPKYFFSHELRLTTFSLLDLPFQTDHLLLGSKLTEYGIRVLFFLGRSTCLCASIRVGTVFGLGYHQKTRQLSPSGLGIGTAEKGFKDEKRPHEFT